MKTQLWCAACIVGCYAEAAAQVACKLTHNLKLRMCYRGSMPLTARLVELAMPSDASDIGCGWSGPMISKLNMIGGPLVTPLRLMYIHKLLIYASSQRC